jgi:hypothetical protein
MDNTMIQLQRASQHVGLFFLRMKNSVLESFRQLTIPSDNKTHVELKEPTVDEMYAQEPVQKIMSSVEPDYKISNDEEVAPVTELNVEDSPKSSSSKSSSNSSFKESLSDETNLKDE